MAAMTNNQASWKQQAMQQAEKLTDLWDVIKAWAGRSAEIVLTICMFVQLIGVLPGVHYWPWVDNAVLAIQMVMLDMGAFALHTLAEQARLNGQDEAARSADRLAAFLIRLMIATIGLIIVGQLSAIFPDVGKVSVSGIIKQVVSYIELVLILVRVVFTVKYIHTIHSLRGSAAHALQPIQVADAEAIIREEIARGLKSVSEQVSQHQQAMHDRIAALVSQADGHLQEVQETVHTLPVLVQSQTGEHLQGVQTELGRGVQEMVQMLSTLMQDQTDAHLRGVQTEIGQEVQTALQMLLVLVQNQTGSLIQQVQTQVEDFLTEQVQIERFASHANTLQELATSLQEVKQEMRTTITEVRTVTRQGGAGKGARESLKLAQAPIVEAKLAPLAVQTGVQERVQKFIAEQLARGCKPKLGEIIEGCNVSKHTAIKYRRMFLGEDESEASEEAVSQ